MLTGATARKVGTNFNSHNGRNKEKRKTVQKLERRG
jgi:hypothetical protein